MNKKDKANILALHHSDARRGREIGCKGQPPQADVIGANLNKFFKWGCSPQRRLK